MIQADNVIHSIFEEFSNLVEERKDNITHSTLISENTDVGNLPKSFKAAVLTDFDIEDEIVIAAARELVQRIEEEYHLFCTLCVYYSQDGFIDWHTNSNANLYNAICTFSSDGNSFFEYENPSSEVIRLTDPIGWHVKKTFWGSKTPIKHRAVSSDVRITLTFSSKDESAVDNFIESITGG